MTKEFEETVASVYQDSGLWHASDLDALSDFGAMASGFGPSVPPGASRSVFAATEPGALPRPPILSLDAAMRLEPGMVLRPLGPRAPGPGAFEVDLWLPLLPAIRLVPPKRPRATITTVSPQASSDGAAAGGEDPQGSGARPGAHGSGVPAPARPRRGRSRKRAPAVDRSDFAMMADAFALLLRRARSAMRSV